MSRIVFILQSSGVFLYDNGFLLSLFLVVVFCRFLLLFLFLFLFFCSCSCCCFYLYIFVLLVDWKESWCSYCARRRRQKATANWMVVKSIEFKQHWYMTRQKHSIYQTWKINIAPIEMSDGSTPPLLNSKVLVLLHPQQTQKLLWWSCYSCAGPSTARAVGMLPGSIVLLQSSKMWFQWPVHTR